MSFTMHADADRTTSAYARDPQRPGLVSRLLMPWNPPAAGEPTSRGQPMMKFMNTHVSRRSIFAASSGLVAAAVVPAGAGPANLPVIPDENKVAFDVLTRLHDEMLEHIEAHKEAEARSSAALQALFKAHRDAFHEFDEAAKCSDFVVMGREMTEDETARYDAALEAKDEALTNLCSHRCATIGEHEAKLQFLHIHLEMVGEVSQGALDAFFTSSEPIGTHRYPTLQERADAIDRVRQMQSDGYVFVARGHPLDINNYATRRDTSEGDDTAYLLKEMGRQLSIRKREADMRPADQAEVERFLDDMGGRSYA